MKVETDPAARRRSRGITMVEIMVVIVIVAALAVVGFSVASRAKTKANSMQCLQNLRDWSVVFSSAAADRNGRVPTPQNWAAISNNSYDPNRTPPGRAPFVDYWDPDIRSAFRIQLDKRGCPCLERVDGPSGNRAPTYMMNWRMSRPPHYLEMDTATIRRPSKKLFFLDGKVGAPLRLNGVDDITEHSIPAAEAHGGRINAVFCDLHIEPVPPQELADHWEAYALPDD